MAGVAGFGPTNARVKVWCLTAWLHPNIGTAEPGGRGALFRCPIIISHSSASVKVYGRFFHAVGRKNAEKTRLPEGTGRRANLHDGGESPGEAFANGPADRAEEPGREGGSREASDGRAAGGREH